MFRPRPYDPDREDKRTPAQIAACARNFRIFKLRGLYTQVSLLTGKRRDQARKLVDQELVAMGAKPQATHERERKAAWVAKREKRRARDQAARDAISGPPIIIDDKPF